MKKELRRNEPAEKGENNDSNLRDESALQPESVQLAIVLTMMTMKN
jgi:hypothetical protein